jgi:hypothetical protein
LATIGPKINGGDDMYFNPNEKWYSFTYKNQLYSSGTKLIYNGKCYLNEHEIILNNQIVTYLYDQNNKTYFQDNNKIYTCSPWDFTKRIAIIVTDIKPAPVKQETEFYWTDGMVVKTIWYVIIMFVAVIFKDCIGIWIFATIVWYNSVFKNKK